MSARKILNMLTGLEGGGRFVKLSIRVCTAQQSWGLVFVFSWDQFLHGCVGLTLLAMCYFCSLGLSCAGICFSWVVVVVVLFLAHYVGFLLHGLFGAYLETKAVLSA